MNIYIFLFGVNNNNNMNRLKHFIPLTICIIFACSFLFVSIESKAYYINCNLVGSRSGTDVMESDILMGRDVIDAKNLIKTSKNTSLS